MPTAVALYSGGLDSTVLLYLLLRESYDNVHALSILYGQRHDRELASAQYIANNILNIPHRTISIIGQGQMQPLFSKSALTSWAISVPEGHYEAPSMKLTVVPNRNAIMLALAYGIGLDIGADAVVYAAHAGDHAIYPDCRPEFVAALQNAFNIGSSGMYELPVIYSPFITMTKAEIVKLGAQLDVPFANTWSCYKGGEHHCGRCGTCVERKEAFRLAQVVDPTPYDDPDYMVAAYRY